MKNKKQEQRKQVRRFQPHMEMKKDPWEIHILHSVQTITSLSSMKQFQETSQKFWNSNKLTKQRTYYQLVEPHWTFYGSFDPTVNIDALNKTASLEDMKESRKEKAWIKGDISKLCAVFQRWEPGSSTGTMYWDDLKDKWCRKSIELC